MLYFMYIIHFLLFSCASPVPYVRIYEVIAYYSFDIMEVRYDFFQTDLSFDFL